MRNFMKRLLSLLLVMALVCSMLPATVLAQTDVDTASTVHGRIKMPDLEPEYIFNPLLGENRDPQTVFPAGFTVRQPRVLANTAEYGDLEAAGAQLRAGMAAHQTEVEVHLRSTSSDSSSLALQIFYKALEHTGQPTEGDYLAWQWDGLAYGRSMTKSGGYYYHDYTFSVDYYVTAAQESRVNNASRQLLDQLNLYNKSDYEKVKGVYDWICANVKYDHANLEDDSYSLKYTCYAALIDRVAVCQGYALLMYRLLLSLGVDCRLIASIDHGYNIIRLGNLYYYGDTTWDAGLAPRDYEYFLQNEENFEDCASHIRVDCSEYYGEGCDYTSSAFYAKYPMSPTPYTPADQEEPSLPVSGNCGANATWSMNRQTGILTIAGSGSMYDFTGAPAPWMDYQAEIKQVSFTGTVSNVGAYAFRNLPNLTNVTFSAAVKTIGAGAFEGCGRVTALTLPQKLETIGSRAFAGSGLRRAVFPDTVKTIGVEAFADCTALAAVTLSRGLTTIGGYAFSGCTALKKVGIPATVITLGAGAFMDCAALSEVSFQGSAPSIGTDAFGNVTATVTYYADSTWTQAVMKQYGGRLTWVNLGEDAHTHEYSEVVTPPTCTERGYTTYTCSCGYSYVSDYVDALGHEYIDGECGRCGEEDPNYFPAVSGDCGDDLSWLLDSNGLLTITGISEMYHYSSANPAPWYAYKERVKEIVVEGSAESIGNYAFCQLPNLTKVTVQRGVLSIGGHAMSSCPSLASVTIPDTVLEMGESVFVQSSKLTSAGPAGGSYAIKFGWKDVLPANAFMELGQLTQVVLPDSMAAIGAKAFLNCSALSQVNLPGNLVSIGAQAFEQTGLTDLTIPANVAVIGGEAFEGCPLTRVTMGEKMVTIGYAAFRSCGNLTTLELPESLLEIGTSAFEGCTGLREITFRGSAPQIGNTAFGNVNATVYYPGMDNTWTSAVRQNYGGYLIWTPYGAPNIDGVIRLAGSSRYETAFAVADQLKDNLGVESFDCVVVAYGQNFPDALTGSYLASVKNAPILLTENNSQIQEKVTQYIQKNVVEGGTVYILGGTAAVGSEFEEWLQIVGFRVIRLKGANRYDTNLAILREAGVNTACDVLIATGKNYADSLSASATGLPMLLVGDKLTEAQQNFLWSTSRRFVIIGGTGAVSQAVEAELSAIGEVVRIKGSDRYATSVEIAKRYFDTPMTAVLAYAQGFPDGLCGGPLAITMGAPLVLTSNDNFAIADDYIRDIYVGAVTGGTGRISDDTVRQIFDLNPGTPIPKR